MSSREAQTSLDTIRSLGRHTVDESADHGFAWRYLVLSVVAVFLVFASFDLPGPWDRLVVATGLGLSVLAALRMRRGARVHRRLTGPERRWYLAAAVVFLVLCVGFQVAAAVLAVTTGLPAHHTIGAAATALTLAALVPAGRARFRAVARASVR
ncbi:hypothetical protein GCM10027445_21560 [Amycolatopsis endophytica]|uniref:Uncharacterized protein n=1 Tax=Amycolatopsis endophytica TaxID=860233 RepID=A0A853BC39_9PSEU|nr:hypothetical protein [Amycolatopsis endophytica]NYI92948.1 hypothetical protein [Amycolatopsis endophytica]